MLTNHKIFYSDARNMENIHSQSIDLVITSPPYPMISMWDDLFSKLNQGVKEQIENGNGVKAYELMHQELDKVWSETYRVLKDGGIACINIGDATRTLDKNFQLFSNSSRIINQCLKIGFSSLPLIIWRKQTNAPNKFMGSGMLPVGAYVTLEHEYIIILRKGRRREFKSIEEKKNRRESSFFWEERNCWFSDIWDFKGKKQELNHNELRKRSAAFPFELAYRLVNMFSVRGDTILDPFLGTGTTMFAAMSSCRNSVGIEIDDVFENYIEEKVLEIKNKLNEYIEDRIQRHMQFVIDYERTKKEMKYININYNFSVMTKPEKEIIINFIDNINIQENSNYEVAYIEDPSIKNRINSQGQRVMKL